MAKQNIIASLTQESAEKFKALAAGGVEAVAAAAQRAGLKFITEVDTFGNRKSVRPGSILHYQEWRFEEYKGAPEALISCGLIEAHMIPERVGRKVYVPSTGKDDPALRTVTRRTEKMCSVWVHIAEEVAEARCAAYHAEMKRRQEETKRAEARDWLERSRAKNYQKEIDEMPKSAEQFRTEVSERAVSFLGLIRCNMLQGKGYFYSEELLCEFEQLADQMEQLLLSGEVGFDQAERDSEVQALRALGAKYNPQLQGMLAVARTTSLVKHEQREAA